MKHDKKFTEDSKIEAFRLPLRISEEARMRARAEDLTFSQLMRRAIRNELGKYTTELKRDAA